MAKAKGEEHGMCRTSEAEIDAIRDLVASGEATKAEIALIKGHIRWTGPLAGVVANVGWVFGIVSRKAWAHLPLTIGERQMRFRRLIGEPDEVQLRSGSTSHDVSAVSGGAGD